MQMEEYVYVEEVEEVIRSYDDLVIEPRDLKLYRIYGRYSERVEVKLESLNANASHILFITSPQNPRALIWTGGNISHKDENSLFLREEFPVGRSRSYASRACCIEGKTHLELTKM